MISELKVLVAEDESEIADIIAENLRKMGFCTIDIAQNGEEALEKCMKRARLSANYDIVISDWNMPKLSGLELLVRLRESKLCRRVLFMMVTANGERDRIELIAKYRPDAFLLKPFKQEEFEKRIKTLVAS